MRRRNDFEAQVEYWLAVTLWITLIYFSVKVFKGL